MLSDRRPILLANARILDPSRDLDIDGDLLIADGVIREAKRGIGAAGVPEGTEVIDCKGKVVTPGLIDMRAFVGEPGAEYRETIASASQAAAALLKQESWSDEELEALRHEIEQVRKNRRK